MTPSPPGQTIHLICARKRWRNRIAVRTLKTIMILLIDVMSVLSD
jgi:hypothetical protein